VNQPEKVRAVSWAAIYVLFTFVVLVGIFMGAAIYKQSRSNGDLAQRIASCTDPNGGCYQDAARARLALADLINAERREDLAAAFVCFRDHPKASRPALVACIDRAEADRLHR
jgi:hypothetical protein